MGDLTGQEGIRAVKHVCAVTSVFICADVWGNKPSHFMAIETLGGLNKSRGCETYRLYG